MTNQLCHRCDGTGEVEDLALPCDVCGGEDSMHVPVVETMKTDPHIRSVELAIARLSSQFAGCWEAVAEISETFHAVLRERDELQKKYDKECLLHCGTLAALGELQKDQDSVHSLLLANEKRMAEVRGEKDELQKTLDGLWEKVRGNRQKLMDRVRKVFRRMWQTYQIQLNHQKEEKIKLIEDFTSIKARMHESYNSLRDELTRTKKQQFAAEAALNDMKLILAETNQRSSFVEVCRSIAMSSDFWRGFCFFAAVLIILFGFAWTVGRL